MIDDIKLISETENWHAISGDEALVELNTSGKDGLSAQEAANRLELYGHNQLVEKPRPTFLQMFIGQLNNFLVILLIVAAVISLLLGEAVESIAIISIVILNAVLGVVQEGRAEEALAALKKLAAPDAQVVRGGRRLNIPASQLVPGDIVYLEAGNFIPADLRLLEAVNLKIEEASLTGEAEPVSKDANQVFEGDPPLGDRRNLAYMGTTATYGRGHAVVISTGMKTELGKIAAMLQDVEDEDTPLQVNLDKLGRQLGIAAIVIVGMVFAIGVVRAVVAGDHILEQIKESFMIAISLAIAAVPEGLPAVVTISLALGMREMVRRHALIRRLASVETLGSATVICSDKTGTLTQNKMTATQMWVDDKFFNITGSGYSPNGKFNIDGQEVDLVNYPGALTTLWVGALNNDSLIEVGQTDDGNGHETHHIIGDPTEGAILVAAEKAGSTKSKLNAAFPRFQEVPFDSALKRMITLHTTAGADVADISPIYDEKSRKLYAVTVKGAPDVVLQLCSSYAAMNDEVHELDEAARRRVLDANDVMTHKALRVLGMAYRLIPDLPEEITNSALEEDLIFAGLVGMIDPARSEVTPALEQGAAAGIRTIMITGDYPATARAIAQDIRLLREGSQTMTGNELNDIDNDALREAVRHTDVFARVSPEHKMRIVDALRSNGEVVAMTGDGVNDAPAIKRADIGVAMGITGTDVAKETADMVLTDDNYASIVSAIEQGRVIYSNIRKFVYYLLSCNLAEIGVIFLATLFGWRSPLTALQLLWLNLLTDGAPALALAAEKGDPGIMNKPPRPPDEPIINRHMQIGIVVQTIAITATTLIAFFIGLSDPVHTHYAETMAFVTLSTSELFRAYTARSEYFPLLKIGVFTNKWMNYAILVSMILILVVVYVPVLNGPFGTEPLSWLQWIEILPLILIPSVVAEVTKFVLNKKA